MGVRWTGNLGPADFVTIALSKNDGRHYRWILVPTTGTDGAETLRVHPAWSTPRGRLKVSWQANPEVAGRSEGFAIGPH